MPLMLMTNSTQFLIQDCEFVSSKAIESLGKRASSGELDQYEIPERIHRYFQPIQEPIPHQILNLVNLSVNIFHGNRGKERHQLPQLIKLS